ncbi:calcineurin-like phosphoesterase C-terminal domain-containing protein [Cyclobacterium roseum]|uniref:calcineurin-like phosphoesterase C-terminal domain-containing protein n=1 Tax=Cyclobacterium roseum TaxID=2666137 RepID=UPI00139106C3|nr:calcineurin-like phosphoesterase family protein [Cyclobacterium roseum]
MKPLLLSYLLSGLHFIFLLNEILAQEIARGQVYQDLNNNGKLDPGEPGIPSVLVTNGVEVTESGPDGGWKLPVREGQAVFIIKPAGYQSPLNANHLAQYYYWHQPNGSPFTEVAGLTPTGPLPEQINFPLHPQEEEDRFEVLLFGDPQARGIKEVNYVSHDVIEECLTTDAAFGITLGDIVADDPALFEEISESTAQIGIPWYYVFGNHDHNRDVTEDPFRDETFNRFFGPSTYAFEYGKVAFIVIRDIHYDESGKYTSQYTDEQLNFIKNFLDFVPLEKRVVIVQHAPITRTQGRKQLFQLLQNRPYTLSIAGHTHTMNHVFIDQDEGWKGETPHHHFINATVSGSWWVGLKDETGIPHATMNDGAPNGYSLVEFDGTDYRIRFKAARRPASYQMNIHLPDDIPTNELKNTAVLVNVFAGSEKSQVKMRVGDSNTWIPMQFDPQEDPLNAWMHSLDKYLDLELSNGTSVDEGIGWKMDPPQISNHIWTATLPDHLSVGTHRLEVETQDQFGQEYRSYRIFRVRK